MDTEKPFDGLDSVDHQLVKLRVKRDLNALRFEEHWRALCDPEVRKALFKDAVHDAIHGLRPGRQIAEMLSESGIASQLMVGMFTHRGGLLRRFLTSLVSLAAPALLAKVPWARAIGMVREKLVPSENGHEEVP